MKTWNHFNIAIMIILNTLLLNFNTALAEPAIWKAKDAIEESSYVIVGKVVNKYNSADQTSGEIEVESVFKGKALQEGLK